MSDSDDDSPIETPVEIAKRFRWTRITIASCILVALLHLFWHFSQPDWANKSQFPVLMCLSLIPASFLHYWRDAWESGIGRLMLWIFIAYLGTPTLLGWALGDKPFLGHTAQWAYAIYCILATFFFLRTFGKFISLLESIWDGFFGDDDYVDI